MAIFNSKLLNYQRVYTLITTILSGCLKLTASFVSNSFGIPLSSSKETRHWTIPMVFLPEIIMHTYYEWKFVGTLGCIFPFSSLAEGHNAWCFFSFSIYGKVSSFVPEKSPVTRQTKCRCGSCTERDFWSALAQLRANWANAGESNRFCSPQKMVQWSFIHVENSGTHDEASCFFLCVFWMVSEVFRQTQLS